MFVALILTSIAIGIAAISQLWVVNPILAILCTPLVACFIISANLMVGIGPRRTRHGVRLTPGKTS